MGYPAEDPQEGLPKLLGHRNSGSEDLKSRTQGPKRGFRLANGVCGLGKEIAVSYGLPNGRLAETGPFGGLQRVFHFQDTDTSTTPYDLPLHRV